MVGAVAKKKAEAANFEAFKQAHPNFAWRSIVDIQWGSDPPDILCLDALGKRIGIELTQWVNERQMAASKRRFGLENSYHFAIQSSEVTPPPNIGMVFMSAKCLLAPETAPRFREELYKFIGAVDTAWRLHPDWDNPQGCCFSDLPGYPCLAQHAEGLDIYARGGRFNPAPGIEWITVRAHGGAYTAQWMLDALLMNIARKIAKYAKPHNNQKLKSQKLAEFYLLIYYDEGVLHNTPYHVPSFGFREIGVIVGSTLAAKPHPFDKVFLSSPIENPSVIQVWP